MSAQKRGAILQLLGAQKRGQASRREEEELTKAHQDAVPVLSPMCHF